VYISWGRRGCFGSSGLRAYGLYSADSQSGKRRAVFQKAAAAGLLGIHGFLPNSQWMASVIVSKGDL
jgi:hypothetical protein